jgi:hypothetical protein
MLNFFAIKKYFLLCFLSYPNIFSDWILLHDVVNQLGTWLLSDYYLKYPIGTFDE